MFRWCYTGKSILSATKIPGDILLKSRSCREKRRECDEYQILHLWTKERIQIFYTLLLYDKSFFAKFYNFIYNIYKLF